MPDCVSENYDLFLKDETSAGNCSFDSECGHCFIFLEKDCTQGQIVHEACHAAFYILQYLGFELIPGKSCEAYTYLIQFIYETINTNASKDTK